MKNPKFTKSWTEHELDLMLDALKSDIDNAKDEEDEKEKKAVYVAGRQAAKVVKACLSDFTEISSDDVAVSAAKAMLNRLLDGIVLTPIKDNDFDKPFDDDGTYLTTRSPRMIRMQVPENDAPDAKKVTVYSDMKRVKLRDIATGDLKEDEFATSVVDKLFPITMPYFPMPYALYIVNVTQEPLVLDKPDPEGHVINSAYRFIHVISVEGRQLTEVKDIDRYYTVYPNKDGDEVHSEITELDYLENHAKFEVFMKDMQAAAEKANAQKKEEADADSSSAD